MKQRILVERTRNELGEPLVNFPKVSSKSEWVDLFTSQECVLNAPQAGTLRGHDVKHRDVVSEVTYIPLGVSLRLPEGFEAVVALRNPVAKSIGVMPANGIVVFDGNHPANNEQWTYPVVSLRKTSIAKNTRLCQFRIQPSQKATVWQKLRWLLTSGIEFVEIDQAAETAENV